MFTVLGGGFIWKMFVRRLDFHKRNIDERVDGILRFPLLLIRTKRKKWAAHEYDGRTLSVHIHRRTYTPAHTYIFSFSTSENWKANWLWTEIWFSITFIGSLTRSLQCFKRVHDTENNGILEISPNQSHQTRCFAAKQAVSGRSLWMLSIYLTLMHAMQIHSVAIEWTDKRNKNIYDSISEWVWPSIHFDASQRYRRVYALFHAVHVCSFQRRIHDECTYIEKSTSHIRISSSRSSC